MKSVAKMKYHFGLRVRIYPSDQQKQLIKVNSDASRFVYNEMVAIDKELYLLGKVKVPICLVQERIFQLQQRKNAKQMANHYQFLEDPRVDSLTKANAIQNYHKAWKAFRKVHTIGVPKFHRKSYIWRYQTNCQYSFSKHEPKRVYLTNGSVRFLGVHHLKVPKLGKLRVSGSLSRLRSLLSRTAETRIGTVTISKDQADSFYLSMQLGSDSPFVQPLKPTKNQSSIGIDLNIENFLTDSNGSRINNPKFYRTIKGKLAKAQRVLSRRQRRAKKEHRPLAGAKDYQQQRHIVAKLQVKVAHQRENFLQQLSTTLIKSHDLVVAEELRSKNLLKNHALAISISDVGWRSFLTMLEYKANLYGRHFVTVNPKNTTQTCHDCGFVMGTDDTKKLTLNDREWTCPHCHQHHIRDYNAALNILSKGIE